MRKLVTLETVVEVRPIPDADAIEAIVIRGWVVVAKRGEFQVGDRCVYFEIDSALPLSDERFAFLGARGTNTTLNRNESARTKNGTAGRRLQPRRGTASGVVPGLTSALKDHTQTTNQTPPKLTMVPSFGVACCREVGTTIAANMGGHTIGTFTLPTSLCSRPMLRNLKTSLRHSRNPRTSTWVPTKEIDGTSLTYIDQADCRARTCVVRK